MLFAGFVLSLISCFTVSSVCLINHLSIKARRHRCCWSQAGVYGHLLQRSDRLRGSACPASPVSPRETNMACADASAAQPRQAHQTPLMFSCLRAKLPFSKRFRGEKWRLMVPCVALSIVFLRQTVCSLAVGIMQMWPGSAETGLRKWFCASWQLESKRLNFKVLRMKTTWKKQEWKRKRSSPFNALLPFHL